MDNNALISNAKNIADKFSQEVSNTKKDAVKIAKTWIIIIIILIIINIVLSGLILYTLKK